MRTYHIHQVRLLLYYGIWDIDLGRCVFSRLLHIFTSLNTSTLDETISIL